MMTTKGERPLCSIAAIRAAARADYRWWNPETMRWWRCRAAETSVIVVCDGSLFVTSEKPDYDRPRRYTVRFAYSTGHRRGEIETIGEHMQWATLAGAKAAAKARAASWRGIDAETTADLIAYRKSRAGEGNA